MVMSVEAFVVVAANKVSIYPWKRKGGNTINYEGMSVSGTLRALKRKRSRTKPDDMEPEPDPISVSEQNDSFQKVLGSDIPGIPESFLH